MKISVIHIILLFLSLQFASATAFSQSPEVKTIFIKMLEATKKIETIRYQADSKFKDGSKKDTVFSFAAKVMATRAPQDSIFGFYFHLDQTSKPMKADYFYDGENCVQVYHKHPDPELMLTVSFISPAALRNKFRLLKPGDVLHGFVPELTMQKLPNELIPYLNTMKAYETARTWVIQWEEEDTKNDFSAQHQLVISKETNLITEVHRRFLHRGYASRLDIVIKNVRINLTGEKGMTSPQNPSGYKKL